MSREAGGKLERREDVQRTRHAAALLLASAEASHEPLSAAFSRTLDWGVEERKGRERKGRERSGPLYQPAWGTPPNAPSSAVFITRLYCFHCYAIYFGAPAEMRAGTG